MWYFSWLLGTAFAVCFGIINAMYFESRAEKECSGTCKNNCKNK